MVLLVLLLPRVVMLLSQKVLVVSVSGASAAQMVLHSVDSLPLRLEVPRPVTRPPPPLLACFQGLSMTASPAIC